LYEVFFVKRKICVVSGPGRRVGGPLEARSCPSKPWRRKMSLAGRLSRPKPPEAVAEGQPLQGSGQRRRSAAEVGGPRLRPSLAWSFAPPTRVRTKAAARRRAERLRRGAHGHARPLSGGFST